MLSTEDTDIDLFRGTKYDIPGKQTLWVYWPMSWQNDKQV